MKRLIINADLSFRHIQFLKKTYVKRPKQKYYKSLYSRLYHYQVNHNKFLVGINKKSIDKMVDYLLEYYDKIILSKPSKLIEIENGFENLVFSEGITSAIQLKSINEFLTYIFDYEVFSKTENKFWNPLEFTKSLNISVCPFCNAQYTFTQGVIEKSNNIKFKIRPDLDHFFVQKKHPMLALSIYNLVPSCSICNSKLKGEKDGSLDKTIHPYLESIDEITYFKRIISTKNRDGDPYAQILGFDNGYKLELKEKDVKHRDKVCGFESVYRLGMRYEPYKEIISRSIKKSMLYTDTYIVSLDNAYGFFNKKKITKEFYNDDINNDLLSKVKNDIFKYEIFPLLNSEFKKKEEEKKN
ncbi:hypothetical protein MKZ08_06735 [Viridibacillus sp. FSL R5-0477]|uniref:HNH nuclease n=1 Tax=Viridibacillus arenosi FSL R5-213 TaxID=1227360 RepID=W4ENU2_9BACL|nr:hypothetical protein [Viridibacillus arenosi]ETT82245.1 HNH nuclease [Viridibacillus arenosi FSL R5-213]OMC92650.1 hypothetical protein BK137_06315 [Viridibacillus arenosi]